MWCTLERCATGCIHKKVDPFKSKLSIINCSDCVKTQGFLLMGQSHLKIYGISIGYGKFEFERVYFFMIHPVVQPQNVPYFW